MLYVAWVGGKITRKPTFKKIWESKFLSSSGFYTNRLRYCEMRRIFTEAGFRVVVEDLKNWDELPIQFHKLHHDFQSYPVEELKIREVVIVLEK